MNAGDKVMVNNKCLMTEMIGKVGTVREVTENWVVVKFNGKCGEFKLRPMSVDIIREVIN